MNSIDGPVAMCDQHGEFSLHTGCIPCARTPHAIGLSGFARSGKTAAASYLERYYGYARRHIAEPLRAMIEVFLRENGVDERLIPRYLTGDLKEAVIPEIGCSARHLQITIGTEWGRYCVHPDIWVQMWARKAKERRLVQNDSVRFPNEERSIRDDLNGFTILIERPGTEPIAYKWGIAGKLLYRWFGLMWGVHDSERTDRLNPDYRIQNNGSLDDLYNEIDVIMALRTCAA